MNLSKVTRFLTTVNLSTPIGTILMVAGAACLIKGAYELIKSAKEEGAREELLGIDPDEEPEESPKTLKSIVKAACKKVGRILNVYGDGIWWLELGVVCLQWMDVFDVATACTAIDYAKKFHNEAKRERKLKDDLISGICKFSHKLAEEANNAFHISDGMDHSKMGFKFVRQKARTLESVCDWMDEFLGKPLAAVNVTRN